jgi:hypothetical protein
MAASIAFLVPVAALIIALSMKTSEAITISTEEHCEFKKCPFCAESVRKETIEFKHCGSA